MKPQGLDICVPPTHPNECDRVAALHRYGILDTPKEQEYDEIASLASALCKTPVAVVNFVDHERQFFKAEVGLGVTETPLETSFCGHALLEEDILVVPDTTLDHRFRDNPLVANEPHLRFYAGVLLTTSENFPIGTVCVLDYAPRELDSNQIKGLKFLAKHAMTLLDLRLKVAELDQALVFRKQVLNIVSHDLRNPIGSIALNATTLAKHSNQSPDRIAEIAESIGGAAKQMNALVGELLDHDALSRNTLTMKIAPIDLSEQVIEFSQMFSPLVIENGRTLSCEIPKNLPQILCDPARFLQILSNLCGNALKFSEAGTEIRLSAREIDGFVEVAVEDCGAGVASEEIEQIFEPFFKGAKPSGGVGLGLSIVRSLIKEHGGTIQYDASYTHGARFLFTLPIAELR